MKKLANDMDIEVYAITENGKIIGFTGLIHNDWNETLQVLDTSKEDRRVFVEGIPIDLPLKLIGRGVRIGPIGDLSW